ncbi:MAG: DegT/DnrJ/EryC1/StrS family aminotransferase [Planctomycetaceae bacterium]
MSKLALLGGSKSVTLPAPAWPVWDDDDRRAVNRVLESGRWWMYAAGNTELGAGDDEPVRSEVEQFEREFAAAHRVKHALAVSSGSMALEICMRVIDLKPGDEVITTPYTFIATSTCILNAGALPVYVDIDRATFNIDPARIEEAITERTRAILPVYFAGEMADIEAICKIASRHKLAVIEDAAQAPGVSLKGDRYAGSFGVGAIFSFQASKTLNSGEGGVILTNSDEFADRAWGLRHCGRTKDSLWYEHHSLGFNARMTEFCGALLRTQLKKLDKQNELRMTNVARFFDKLRGIDGIVPAKLHPDATRRSHYLVILRYDQAAWNGLPRERFLEALNAEGLPCMAGYTFTNFENPLFRKLDFSSRDSVYMLGRKKPIDYAAFEEKCPHAIRACREEAVWLMHTSFLGDARLVDQMADAIIKIRENHRELM